MNTIQVEIISPKEAKALNPLGSVNGCINAFVTYAMWQEAEQKRRVFKIVNLDIFCGDVAPVGAVFSAEIVNEREVVIKLKEN